MKRGLDIVRLTFVAVLVLAIALTAGCAEGNKTKVTETNGGKELLEIAARSCWYPVRMER